MRVVTYHRIAEPARTPDLDPALISATPEAFRRQMVHLRKWYDPVSMDDVLAAFTEGRRLPRRAVHVTVDDAYRDFRSAAWPILRELGIPVTVFVPSAYPGSPRGFWWDRLHRAYEHGLDGRWEDTVKDAAIRHGAVAAGDAADDFDARATLRQIPHDVAEALVDDAVDRVGVVRATVGRPDVLEWEELRELQGEGVRFGAHTRHHVSLSRDEDERIRTELRRSADDIERELGHRPVTIGYPYGMCDERVADIARAEGFVLGFTCEDGLNRPGYVDPLRLRRTNITPRTTPGVFRIRMLPWFAGIDRWRHRDERKATTG